MNQLRQYFEGLQVRGNIYVAFAFRLLLVMILFTACRIGFYLFNLSSFPDMTAPYFMRLLKGGLVFDLSAILYINALYIVLIMVPLNFRFNTYYQKIVKYMFIITNGIALAANVSDFIYYKFTLCRTTADVFRQFENETNMPGLIGRFILDYW